MGGQYAVASQVNANFDALYGWVNGSAVWADASQAFTNVPSGPATDPSTPNQFTRKSYVDAGVTGVESHAYAPTAGGGSYANNLQTGHTVITTGTLGTFTVTFPTAFTTTCSGVVISPSSTSEHSDWNVQADGGSFSRTGFGGRIGLTTSDGGATSGEDYEICYIAFGA